MVTQVFGNRLAVQDNCSKSKIKKSQPYYIQTLRRERQYSTSAEVHKHLPGGVPGT